MTRSMVVGLLLGFFAGSAEDSSVPPPPSARVRNDAVPDPTRARALGRWPNAADLARLQSVEGKPKTDILQILGHPCRVERQRNGEEVWDYPWPGCCCVWVRNGVCTWAFYTAGY